MKTKRTLSILLSVILAFSMAIPAFAAETTLGNDEEILREAEYQAENGCAKVSETDSFVILETTRKVSTGTSSYTRNANNIEAYENECVVFIPSNDTASNTIYDSLSSALPRSVQNGSHEVTEADDYGCARFTLKINYTVEPKDDGFTYYDLISVSGGFYDAYTTGNYVGENVYVRAHSIDVNQFGKPYNSNITVDEIENDYELDVNNRNWTYIAPSEWKPVGDGDIFANVGARYSFTLGRGSSSWSKTIGVRAI